MALGEKRPLLHPDHTGTHPSVVRAEGAPTGMREREHEAHLASDPGLARSGGRPKVGHDVVPVHGAMAHVSDGKLYQSVSRSEVARAPDGAGASPLEPAAQFATEHSRKQRQVKPHPWLQTKSQAGRSAYDPAIPKVSAADVLESGRRWDHGNPINQAAKLPNKTTEK